MFGNYTVYTIFDSFSSAGVKTIHPIRQVSGAVQITFLCIKIALVHLWRHEWACASPTRHRKALWNLARQVEVGQLPLVSSGLVGWRPSLLGLEAIASRLP